jgi:RNA polymerase sigma-70 factor (ECF subfamily)
MPLDHNSQLDLSNEQTLIERLRARDQSALSSIYDYYSSVVYALALRITCHQAEAKEVVVDTFWQVWRQADRYEPSRGSLGAWIMTIARSRALDHRRTMQRFPMAESDEWAQIEAAQQTTGDNPEQQMWLSEQASRVRAALDELTAAQREAIELAFYHGLSHSEIAERLGEPLGTVKTRIRLGLMKLRERLSVQLVSPEKAAEKSFA